MTAHLSSRITASLLLIAMFTFWSPLAWALTNKEVAQIGYFVPFLVLFGWIIKKLFFKQVKISKWVPISIISLFVVALIVTLVVIQQDPIDEYAGEIVQVMNQGTPKMADQDVRIDRASYNKPVLSLELTLVNIRPNELTPQELFDRYYLEEKQELCGSDEFVYALNNGIEMLLIYHDSNGNRITNMDFNKLTCSSVL